MPEIPTREPSEIVAGDTLQWRRDDLAADYPASAGWALAYTLILRSGTATKITINASAALDAHAVSVAASTTQGWAAGEYELQGHVTKAAERFRVYLGTVNVRENLPASSGGARDSRSHAEKVLDAIEAVIERRASKDQEEYSIGGRSLKRTPIGDLIRLRDKYKAEVAREVQAERIRRGLGARRIVNVRFNR